MKKFALALLAVVCVGVACSFTSSTASAATKKYRITYTGPTVIRNGNNVRYVWTPHLQRIQ